MRVKSSLGRSRNVAALGGRETRADLGSGLTMSSMLVSIRGADAVLTRTCKL